MKIDSIVKVPAPDFCDNKSESYVALYGCREGFHPQRGINTRQSKLTAARTHIFSEVKDGHD